MNESLQAVYRTLMIAGVALLLGNFIHTHYDVSNNLLGLCFVGIGIIMTRQFWDVVAIVFAALLALVGSFGRGADRVSDRLNDWVRPSEVPEMDELADDGPKADGDEGEVDKLEAMFNDGSPQ